MGAALLPLLARADKVLCRCGDGGGDGGGHGGGDGGGHAA